jgi:hypothetical protein
MPCNLARAPLRPKGRYTWGNGRDESRGRTVAWRCQARIGLLKAV